MSKKELIIAFICSLMLTFPTFAFPDKKEENLGLSQEEYTRLAAFSKKAKEVKSKMEKSGGISSTEVKQILGKPEEIYKKGEEDLKIKNQKEIWMYKHPCYATVRFLLIFDDHDTLRLFTAVQQLHPKIGDVYYDVDYFLE